MEQQDKMLRSHLVKCQTEMIRDPIEGEILKAFKREEREIETDAI